MVVADALGVAWGWPSVLCPATADAVLADLRPDEAPLMTAAAELVPLLYVVAVVTGVTGGAGR